MHRIHRGRRRAGVMLLEAILALCILGAVMSAYAAVHWIEQLLARQNYYRAVVMQAVDGEMEALLAGEWKTYGEGTHTVATPAVFKDVLPPGRLTATIVGKQVTLKWQGAGPRGDIHVVREGRLP